MSRHSARGRDLRLAARRDIERILHEAEAFAWQARRDTERILHEDVTFAWQPDVTSNAFCTKPRSSHGSPT
jgi:hypothetical protein